MTGLCRRPAEPRIHALSFLQIFAPETLSAPSIQWRRSLAAGAIRWATVTLDVTIACCTLALLIIVTTGGVDLGWMSMTRASRPFLALCVLLPIRFAQPGPVWPRWCDSLRAAGALAAARAGVGHRRVSPSVERGVWGYCTVLDEPAASLHEHRSVHALEARCERIASGEAGQQRDRADDARRCKVLHQAAYPLAPSVPSPRPALARRV